LPEAKTVVQLLATGGTIASRAGSTGRSASVLAAELLASVPDLDPSVEVRGVDCGTKGSYAFTTADLLALARKVRDALAEDVDGVVITHGTDVMEESIFLIDLIHNDPRPVVVTGAQRPFDDAAPDGPANLRDAIVAAADPRSRELGALLVFDGFGYPARGVRKVETLSTHAFDAPGRGPLLRLADGRLWPLAGRIRPQPLPLDLDLEELPRVDVICAYPGADGTLLRASLEAGAAGVVIAALGAGNAGPALVAAAAEAISRSVPVLVCSRVGSGPVLALYAGGGAALEQAGPQPLAGSVAAGHGVRGVARGSADRASWLAAGLMPPRVLAAPAISTARYHRRTSLRDLGPRNEDSHG
jgi:L-asparaginase